MSRIQRRKEREYTPSGAGSRNQSRGVSPSAKGNPLHFYREVTGESLEALLDATRELPQSGATRVADGFRLTLVYPFKLYNLVKNFPDRHFIDPTLTAELLGMVNVPSLRKPVTAALWGIQNFAELSCGVVTTYDTLGEESAALNAQTKDLYGINPELGITVGSTRPHICLTVGQLSIEQMMQVKRQLPPSIELSEVRNPFGPI